MPDGFDRNLVDPDDVIEQRRSALFGGVLLLRDSCGSRTWDC